MSLLDNIEKAYFTTHSSAKENVGLLHELQEVREEAVNALSQMSGVVFREISSTSIRKRSLKTFLNLALIFSTLLGACGTFSPAEININTETNQAEALPSGDSSIQGIENAVSQLNGSLNLISEDGTSRILGLGNVDCISNGETPTLLDFSTGLPSDLPLPLSVCKVDIVLEQSTLSTVVLVEKNNESQGQKWVVVGQGSKDNKPGYAWGYLVPIKDNKLDFSAKDSVQKIEVLKGLSDNVIIYISDSSDSLEDGSGKIWSFHEGNFNSSDSVTPSLTAEASTTLSSSLWSEPSQQIQASLPTPTQENLPTIRTPSIPERNNSAVYSVENFGPDTTLYTSQATESLRVFREHFYEVEQVNPSELVILRNPDAETITILNFSEKIKVNADSVSAIYDYFLSVASHTPEYMYESTDFQIIPPPVLDTTIGIIPSNIALEGSYTQWSVNTEISNMAYIQMWAEENMSRTPTDIYPTAKDVTASSIIIEICQATNRVSIMNSNSVPGNLGNMQMKLQENYCNSRALIFYLKQIGMTNTKIVEFMKTNGRFNHNGELLTGIIFDEKEINSMPLLPPILSDSQ